MIDLGEVKINEVDLKVVMYGLAGTGKTDLLRYFPRPLKLYDFDNKYHPLIGHKDIHVEQYIMNTNEESKQIIPKFWRDVQKDKKEGKYATYAFDSITALNRCLERWSVVMSGKGKDPGDRATLQEYGDIKRWYNTFFPSLLNMPGNVVLLAHEQTKSTAKGDVLSIRPLITGSMGDELSSIFPHTFHLEYIPGANERWRCHYRKHAKYLSSSSVFSGGKGYFEYGRDENVYDLIHKLMEEENNK
jgi:phage nucleotide-binding protein